MSDDSLILYTSKNVEEWERWKEALPDQLDAHESEIKKLLVFFEPRWQQLKRLEQEISKLESGNSSASTDSVLGTVMVVDGENREGTLGDVEVGMGCCMLISGLCTHVITSAQTSTLKTQKKAIEESIASTQVQYDQLVKEQKEWRSQLALANEHLPKAQKFLDDLQNNPETLYSGLVRSIKDKLDVFEKDHPNNQSKTTRYWLYLIRNIIESAELADKAHREKFDYLCALLWVSADDDRSDTHMLAMIRSLINETHLDRDSHGEIFRLTNHPGLKAQEEYLISELNDLKNKIGDRICRLMSCENPAAQEVAKCVKKALEAQKEPDHKFYLFILNCVCFIQFNDQKSQNDLNNPSIQTRKEAGALCLKFAGHLQGRSSPRERVFGALLMGAGGIALIPYSILLIALMSASAPVSAAALIIGAVGVAVCATSLLLGAGLFNQGRQRGASKAVSHFVTSSQEVAQSGRGIPAYA